MSIRSERLPRVVTDVRPRTQQSDVIGALIGAATPRDVAKALDGYNPKLGKALEELES